MPAKLIIGRIAAWAYLTCAVLAVTFTVSFLRSDGGPVVMGYAVIFLLLLLCAASATGSIAAVGVWDDKKQLVYTGAITWPASIYFPP